MLEKLEKKGHIILKNNFFKINHDHVDEFNEILNYSL